MARKKTPLKLVRGSPAVVQLPTDGIKPPAYLCPVGLAKWHETLPLVQAMRVMTTADVEALGRYCDLFAWWTAARAKLRRDGDSYPVVNDKGEVKYHAQRPEVAIAHKLSAQLRSLETDFGLNPSSRKRLDARTPDATANPIHSILARKAAMEGQPLDELEAFFAKHG